MHAEGFPDDGVEERKRTEFLISERTHFTIRGDEAFNLFLIECLTTGRRYK
jgi:hypothetical protein